MAVCPNTEITSNSHPEKSSSSPACQRTGAENILKENSPMHTNRNEPGKSKKSM